MASLRSDDGASVRSLGAAMVDANVIGPGTAKYRALSLQLEQEVQRIAAAEAQRKSEAVTIIEPLSIRTHDESRLERLYPEFNVVWTENRTAVHASFRVERDLALNWAVRHMRKYGREVVALGEVMLNFALAGDESVHVEYDARSPVAVHSSCDAVTDFQALALAGEEVEKKYGVRVSRESYNRFLDKKAHAHCWRGHECGAQGDSYVADGSMYPLSQAQFAAGMDQTGSEVGMFVLPYTPTMIAGGVGELPDTGVYYVRTPTEMRFIYPEGQAGVASYQAHAWAEWISRARFHTRGAEYFSEIVAVRGNYMFILVTRLGEVVGSTVDYHSLELPHHAGKYLVRYAVLRDLYSDPALASSWVHKAVLLDQRVCDNVRAFAMGLPKERFTWEAIQQRVYLQDNRVTVAGSSVKVTRPLTTDEARGLVIAVASRAFVDRFEMGNLSSQLMSELRSVQAFVDGSHARRLGMLMLSAAYSLWDYTFGFVGDVIRAACRVLTKWMRGGPQAIAGAFEQPVGYELMQTHVSRVNRALRRQLEKAGNSGHFVPFLRGSAQVFGDPDRRARTVPIEIPLGEPVEQPEPYQDEDTRNPEPVSELGAEVTVLMTDLNETVPGAPSRFFLSMPVSVPPTPQVWPEANVEEHPDPVASINEFHELTFPGMAQQNFQQDVASLALDPQDRDVQVDAMQLPVVGQSLPGATVVYKSRLRTYAVEKKAQTMPELMSAMQARTLAAPQVSLPLNMKVAVRDVWDNFLDMACRPDAREKIEGFRADVVSFETEAFSEWTKQAKTDTLKALRRQMVEFGYTNKDFEVGKYLVMLKSDAKPPMSSKPIGEQLAPQVIVYHEKLLSAFYSSIFRVLVRRFLSLLKPEWMVNLLKDVQGWRDHMAAHHPWDEDDSLLFLENDFSKYDKSQDEFCFLLEHFAFSELGMDQELLDRWFDGHENCELRSLTLGLKLWLKWQRKSGDGTTSFGNAIVNICAVCKAYQGSQVVWALIQGDDSLVCCRVVAASEQSIGLLSEVFNLQAKFYVGNDPCFGSCFIRFDPDEKQAYTFPDPVKRAQKLAVSVNARDPRWDDRFRSLSEVCRPYRSRAVWPGLERAVRRRYAVPNSADFSDFMAAMATVVGAYSSYRGLYDDSPVDVSY